MESSVLLLASLVEDLTSLIKLQLFCLLDGDNNNNNLYLSQSVWKVISNIHEHLIQSRCYFKNFNCVHSLGLTKPGIIIAPILWWRKATLRDVK